MTSATDRGAAFDHGPVAGTRAPGMWEAELRDWFALLKPRVLTLVVFTGLIGLLVAPGHLHPVLAFTAVLCIAVGAGACGAINMWYDRDIDALMRRTRNRPIPGGRIAPGEALGFGVTLAMASVIVMGLAVNLTAAALLALSIIFYVFVYTVWLKRRTPQNIVIGGAAGAFPALVGWASVTGSVDLLPLIMFAIVFIWTPPHFWSLALYRRKEYLKSGLPMLPNTHGEEFTRLQILLYTIVLFGVSLLPYAVGMSGMVYLLSAIVLDLIFLGYAWKIYRAYSDELARRAFRFSIVYLSLLFAALLVDHYTRALIGF